jgi:hypothetical protein
MRFQFNWRNFGRGQPTIVVSQLNGPTHLPTAVPESAAGWAGSMKNHNKVGMESSLVGYHFLLIS